MGYLHDSDAWLREQLAAWMDEAIDGEELARRIREKILESYKNGLKASGQSPVQREGKRREFRRRRQ